MSDPKRKRKSTNGHSPPPKKFLGDSHNGKESTYSASNPLTPGSWLPKIPNIDDKYREQVFTHSSQATKSNPGYDRLEFLGDAYLEVFASQLIYDRLYHLPEGRMSQVRESLIRNETLSEYTSLYGLDKELKNAKRFASTGSWVKIKGDVFEAYVAAVVLSTSDGYEVARKWLIQLWEPKIQAVLATPAASPKSKEELAKKILGRGVRIDYMDEKKPVIHHGRGKETYYVGVYLTGWGWDNQYLGSGKGLSKVAAGQEAAAAALNNHPLIDEIAAKKAAFYAEVRKGDGSRDQK